MTNEQPRRRRRLLVWALPVALLAGACSGDDELSEPEVVASGLDQPRGLAFDDDGNLLVAEAGRGGEEGCLGPILSGLDMCLGATGAIISIDPDGEQTRIVEGLPSIANRYEDTDDDGDFAFGPHDVAVGDDGRVYVAVGGPGNALDRAPLEPAYASALGTVQEIVDGSAVQLADIAAYEEAFDPHPTRPQSQTNAVQPVGDRLFAADAAGNTVLEVVDGAVELVEVFPDRSDDEGSHEAVPAGLAIGPDGALYLSDLTGAPFPEGGAIVWRLGDDGFEEYATGFTTAQSLAFGPDGHLYVVETHPGAEGRVLRLDPGETDAADAEVVADGLTFPTGIAVDEDDRVYISNMTVFAGEGEILRIR